MSFLLIVAYFRYLVSFETTCTLYALLIIRSSALLCEHSDLSIALLLFSSIAKDTFLSRSYGTKWPLCADVPSSNHAFIYPYGFTGTANRRKYLVFENRNFKSSNISSYIFS